MPSLPPGAGWWSLAVVLELCSRAVVGGAMADCWENAVAESCFHTFKTAVIEVEAWNTHAQAQTAVCAYIDVCSHRQRCQAAHGYLAPLLDEQT